MPSGSQRRRTAGHGERRKGRIPRLSPVVLIGIGLVLAGLAVRLAIAWQDVETLTVKVLPDDAYYYLLTADRIASGHNITFDGITPSNGYHPLWLFFLVPLYLLPGRTLPLHLALTASSIFDVAAGVLIALAVARLTGSRVGALFALTFYLFLPQNIFASVNGVESALAAVLVAALLLVFVTRWRERRDDWPRWSLATGVLGGLAVLARLEAALVFAAVLALVALFQSGRRRWGAPAVAGAVAAAIAAPWFLWSLFAVGTAVPVSAEASTWSLREYFSAAHPGAGLRDEIEHGVSLTKSVLLTQLPRLYFPAKPWAILGLSAAGLAALHALLFPGRPRRSETAKQLLVVALPLAAFSLMLLVNSSYRWSVRAWYFAWGAPLVALLVGVLAAHVEVIVTAWAPSVARRWRLAGGATRRALLYLGLTALLVAAYLGPGRESWDMGHFPFQRENLEAALYLKSHTEPGDRAAAFNAGIIGYFSDRTVVNLDGVVNPDALRALRERRLLEYLRRMDVTYVADRDLAWRVLPSYIRPDDWSQSLWGGDPSASFRSVTLIGYGGIFGQMRVWHLTE